MKSKRLRNLFLKIGDKIKSNLITRDRETLKLVDKDSILWNFGNVFSQQGQDGILAYIFREIGISNGYFVEFGAYDGITWSNTRNLYEKGWKGIFIEANKKRYKKLISNYSSSEVITVNEIVGSPKNNVAGDRLSEIILRHKIPLEKIDFVSIDIDGADLEVFLDLGFKPPVVLLEGGSNFSPLIDEPIDREIAFKNIQHPLGTYTKVIEHGYEIVVFLQDAYLKE